MLAIGVKRGFIKIKTKWFTIGDPEKEKQVERPTGVLSHSGCPNFPSLQGLVKEAIKNSDKIKDLKYETYTDQMQVSRDFLNDVLDKFKTNYLTMYKPYNDGKIAGLLTCSDVKDYYCMLDKLKSPLLDMVEGFVRGNHFAEQTEEDYREYIGDKAKRLQKRTSAYFDEHYDTDNFKISREDLYEANMQLIPEINTIISGYFYKVRIMAIKTANEIKLLEESIKDFV